MVTADKLKKVIEAIDDKHYGGGPAENVLCTLDLQELQEVFELADIQVPDGYFANEYLHVMAVDLAVRELVQKALTRLNINAGQ